MIVVNRARAEVGIRDRLRAERGPRLAALDVGYMRALESGQDTTQIVAEKQALREVTEKDLSPLTLAQMASLTLDRVLEL